MLSAPVSHRSRGQGDRPRAGRLVGIHVLATLVLLAGCASTLGGSASDQVGNGVRAAGQGYWQEAAFRWEKALAIQPGNARALNNLAVRTERAGDFLEAEPYYVRALAAATPAEAEHVRANYEKHRVIWERLQEAQASDDTTAAAGSETPGEDPAAMPAVSGDAGDEAVPPGAAEVAEPLRTMEVSVSVPEEEGPNLAGFSRILVGDFVPTDDTQFDINETAVRYFRRRILQRTYFQTVDLLSEPLPRGRPEILDDAEFWALRAAAVDADLILTGLIGIQVTDESRIVRERIRSPVTGEIEEVARFREMTGLQVRLEYRLLRGADGTFLLGGTAESSYSYPAEEGITESQATTEVFEELLPQVLDATTPRRTEETRVLIY